MKWLISTNSSGTNSISFWTGNQTYYFEMTPEMLYTKSKMTPEMLYTKSKRYRWNGAEALLVYDQGYRAISLTGYSTSSQKILEMINQFGKDWTHFSVYYLALLCTSSVAWKFPLGLQWCSPLLVASSIHKQGEPIFTVTF